MAAILFILLATLAGAALVKRYFEPVMAWPAGLPRLFVVLPAAFVVGHTAGVLLLYGCCMLCSGHTQPLLWGSRLCFALLTAFVVLTRGDLADFFRRRAMPQPFYLALAGAALGIAACLMWYTFSREGSVLKVGYSVWADFGSHLGVARSFSVGANFPPQHPQFAGEGMRYHFFFYFFAGSLEYLGLPLDWAVNLPSTLSYTGFLCMLYALAFALSRSVTAGVLAVVLFLLRSSCAAWYWLAQHWHDQGGLIAAVLHNSSFIGDTAYEDWGIWTQNVFINQRHNTFVLIFILFMLFVLLPSLQPPSAAAQNRPHNAWLPDKWAPYAGIGLLLGLLTFWNGILVLCALLLIAAAAPLAQARLGLLLIGGLGAGLMLLQTHIFTGSVSSVRPQVVLGFLAAPGGVYAVAAYYLKLLGIFPFAWMAAVAVLGSPWRLFSLIAVVPALFGNIVSLSSDATMNHKFLMVSIILGNCAVAALLARGLEPRRCWLRLAAIAALVLLTASGVLDLIAVRNNNDARHRAAYNLEDPLVLWAQAHASRQAVFLAPENIFHPLLLSGRGLYLGNDAFAASAGYDVAGRVKRRNELYSASSLEDFLNKLRADPVIDYVVFEKISESTPTRGFNPDLLAGVLKLVYRDSAGKVLVFAAHP